ncbi:hypothetical protein BJ508DRAFT_413055 [Ascobolus immersus RN42]|uniref:Uncharacterized protein n=1 Tax=Ascobolus immersus RN42 TaxID=1160509 RepID=A0A3N4IIN2_ASCIM|nr:hypothetical protein BJ508DRAFT_413055 [Ascobolus immersus RN42]
MPLKLTTTYRVSKTNSTKSQAAKKLKSILQSPSPTKSSTLSKSSELPASFAVQSVGTREVFRGLKNGSNTTLPSEVISVVRLLLESQFETIPLTNWFSRDEIARLYSIRSALPSVIPVTLLHAFFEEPTRVEREIQRLVMQGQLRIIKVANRGKAFSEWAILFETLEQNLKHSFKDASMDIAMRFIAALMGNQAGTFPVDHFSDSDKAELISRGYLTLETHVTPVAPTPGAFNNVTQISTPVVTAPQLQLSLPSLGSLLRLYSGARNRLNELVPSGKVVTWERIASRWNSERGRETSRIKKWKEFCGLRLEVAVGIAAGEGSLEVVRVCGGGGLGLKGRWSSSNISRKH